MTRLIILTFAFLGFAFYYLSGGAEFEPSKQRLTDVTAAPLKADAPADELPARAGLASEVTRVSLNLTSVDEVLTGGTTQPARIVTPLPDDDAEPAPEAVTLQIPQSSEVAAIIPSLVDGADETTAARLAPLEEASTPAVTDIRAVSGNRVNVRGGPSTGFDVVNSLVRGDEVEVLEEDGAGWVRMRPLDGGTEGWIADFLLTDAQ